MSYDIFVITQNSGHNAYFNYTKLQICHRTLGSAVYTYVKITVDFFIASQIKCVVFFFKLDLVTLLFYPFVVVNSI